MRALGGRGAWIIVGVLRVGAFAWWSAQIADQARRDHRAPPVPRNCPDVRKVSLRTSLPEIPVEAEMLREGVLEEDGLVYDCDASEVLAELFDEVTDGLATDLARAVRWVTWVQNTIATACQTPLDAAGQAI